MDDLTLMKRLAAAVFLAVREAHPVYGSSAGAHGGIGGQALTPSCSFLYPPSENEYWTQYDVLMKPVYELMVEHPELNLKECADELKAELLAEFFPLVE